MGITETVIGRDILSQVNDYVMVIGPDMKIFIINDSLSSVSGLKRDDSPISLFKSDTFVMNWLDENGIKGQDFYNAKIIIRKENGDGIIPVKGRFTVIRDEFKDKLGILFVGKESEGMKQFRNRFRLTGREIEIIQALAAGKTNRIISSDLHISDNTLKAHITNIYNKINVNTRIEMLNLLEDYNP